jgi:bis(5'-nucleosidyl)-tetraphosphatase
MIEKSAGAIIFRKEEGKICYLLLRYPSKKKEYWGFAKGGIEAGEKLEETARREIKEETGLINIEFINGFKVWEKYFFKRDKQNIFKIVTFLLAETKTKDVKISFEHLAYQWLPYEEAFKMLAYKNTKEFLKKANEFILEKGL